ncbi:hypothetical protein JTB14_014899 [Gonioctena quinquepunctata]|nr:hypothetical protein JTB14_014899 [Gonioctena quinquepunctata]
MARQFCTTNSNHNYEQEFLRLKANHELPLDFATPEDLRYNSPFTLAEFDYALSCTKPSAPGPDSLHYEILKHLSYEFKISLLTLFNKIWDSNTYPPQWKEAITVAILKEGKDHQLPSSYRPISLTCCMDIAARNAAEAEEVEARILRADDVKIEYNFQIKADWQREWSRIDNHLKAMRPDVQPWRPSGNLPRADRVKIHRLRFGHTLSTHAFLLEGQDPPICNHCGVVITVSHIICTCPGFGNMRQLLDISEQLSENFRDPTTIKNLTNFSRAINFSTKI